MQRVSWRGLDGDRDGRDGYTDYKAILLLTLYRLATNIDGSLLCIIEQSPR